ncbi:vacuolar protein sorting-associated protein 9A-like isoform X2 [Herrania umbratica]|uniref:Vacuolar protein sorting-associated protein 9A-like isoform X2 n=1 Tax=Herrania umbratica TaxID=108875 RepID=A0A6J1BKA9_9ROSI|nr:vacuolar protein sorting-associated protein 9A-like isoform X2 [Herrania umbratica]
METTHPLPFDSFLDKMRNPASLDLVRSIKSFIVSFSFNVGNPENDGKRIQDFFLTTEAAIRDHPLWAGSTDEEIDNALEGLEKYVMTKLNSRTFASSAQDVKMDREISEKICLLQTFLRPEHLDIPVVLQNEALWLANPPQLHSNLKFIQLYRRQSKLISEAAYYHTNLVSAKSFIVELNAKSLSIEETEFEESMQAARLVNRVPQITSPTIDKISTFGKQTDPGPSTEMHKRKTNINDHHIAILGSAGSNYPYMEAEAGELTVGDVERLLGLYKDVVTKYNSLCNTVRHLSISKTTVSPASEGTNDLLRGHNGTSRDTDCKGE